LDEAKKIEDEWSKILPIEEAARLADLDGDTALGFEARLELVETVHSYPATVLAPFSWCLAQCDRDPKQFSERALLWEYKGIVLGIENLPQIPMDQILGLIEDIARRYDRNLLSPRPIYRIKLFLAMYTGQKKQAQVNHQKWVAAPRDKLADCAACECDTEVQYLIFKGQDDRAIKTAEPILEEGLGCRTVPRQTLAELLLPLVRLGRLVEAMGCHRRGYRLIEGDSGCVHDAAQHLVFLALTNHWAKAIKVFEYYLPFPRYIEVADHAHRFYFTLASRFLMERLRAVGRHSVKFKLPKAFPAYQESGKYDVAALEDWFEADARRIAARFDARNGTKWFTHLIEANHALRELVVHS